MEESTKRKIGTGLATAGAAGYLYTLYNQDKINAKVNQWANEAYRRKMGGTPNDAGGTMEDKLERLARRAKGTPEGAAASAKLKARQLKKGTTGIRGAVKRGKSALDQMISRVRPRKVLAHLMGAREELESIITMGAPRFPITHSSAVAVGDLEALKKSNLARLVERPRNLSHEAGDAASASIINRIRARHAQNRTAQMIAKNQPGLIPNGFVVPLSARNTPDTIIKFGLTTRGWGAKAAISKLGQSGHMSPLKALKVILTKRTPKKGSLAASALAQQLKRLRSEKLLSARDELGGIIELADLGYTTPTPGVPDGDVSQQAGPNKRTYPSLYVSDWMYPCLHVSDCDKDVDLPQEGFAKVKYKLRSQTVRHDNSGKKRHSADIEIQSIDPIEDEKKDGESDEGEPAKYMNPEGPGRKWDKSRKTKTFSSRDELNEIIEFSVKSELHDSRLYSNLRGLATLEDRKERKAAHEKLSKPYQKPSIKEAMKSGLKRMSARDELGELIEFNGERVGEGITGALRKIAARYKTPGAGAVVKRGLEHRTGVDYYPRLIRPQQKVPKKGWYPERSDNSYSAREGLNGIIELGVDPRPRTKLGMFAPQDSEGPDPNEVDIVYKQRPRTVEQNLAGGAVAGIGAASSGMALKALVGKLKKQKIPNL